MRISSEQREFLVSEFGLMDLVSAELDELREIRERCFDIEVHESMKSDDGDGELSQRGEIAVALVDILLPLIKEKKAATVHQPAYAVAAV